MNAPVASASRPNAETCPSCGCHLDQLVDSGCPYCGWNDPPRHVQVVSGRVPGLIESKPRPASSVWGERVLTAVTFVVVAFAAFSLIATLVQLLSSVFTG
jgi:hypothetical protein